MLKYLPVSYKKLSYFLINSGTTLSNDGVNSTISQYGVYTFIKRKDGTAINGFISDKFIYMYTAEKRRKKIVRYRSNPPRVFGNRELLAHHIGRSVCISSH